MTRHQPPRPVIERVQTGVRMEKRLVKVCKARRNTWDTHDFI